MTPLSITHLGFFALIGFYLCAFHPAGEASVVALFFVGVVAELLPRVLRRIFVPELLLLLSIAGCWLLLVPRNIPDGIHAAAGMAITYWLLVPSRLGMLRWVLSLVIVELLLQSRSNNMTLSALICVPIGLAALGIDSWLSQAISARANARMRAQSGSSLMRWALVPTAIAMFIAITVGTWMVNKTAKHHSAVLASEVRRQNHRPSVAVGLEESMSIGQLASVDLDPHIAARLSWETGQDPTGTVYLRAMSLSQLILDGSTLSWKPERTGELRSAPPPTHKPVRWARVLRMPSRNDLILRPDGGDAVDLDGLVIDDDGNYYRSQLGDALRSYRADFDDGQLEANPATIARYRDLDPRLDRLPWAEIEDVHWREVSPERAAVLIRERLQQRCTYALKALPTPANGYGGVIRTFLFGSTPAERIGHCQYFSTAAVLLMRRAGHTARCVVGFASDEIDDRGVVFRGLHAHAWIEIINAQGRWQRFDPTPSAARDRLIIDGVDFGPDRTGVNHEEPQPEELPAAPEPVKPSATTSLLKNWWPLLVPIGVFVLIIVIVQLRRAPRILIDPHLAELQRRNDDLIRLAVALGVPVTPSTTLSNLAIALERRTGVNLTHHLDAHLAARYGNGSMPAPWPLDELRQGAKSRSATIQK
jgi:transglutaminase-like putative cysteine protease